MVIIFWGLPVIGLSEPTNEQIINKYKFNYTFIFCYYLYCPEGLFSNFEVNKYLNKNAAMQIQQCIFKSLNNATHEC